MSKSFVPTSKGGSEHCDDYGVEPYYRLYGCIFYFPDFIAFLNFRCVALLYFLFSIEPNAEVSDTTDVDVRYQLENK